MDPHITLTAVPNIPLIHPGDDLAAIILDRMGAARLTLQDGDVLVICQKIISKAEGRAIRLDQVEPSAQALALVRGRGYVIPDDLQQTAEPALAHRVLLADPLIGDGWEKSRQERAVIRAIVESTPVPR